MSLLTDREIEELYFTEIDNRIVSFAHAIEAAVVAKLAAVNVEPCAWEVATEQQDGTRAKLVSTDRKRHREFCDFGEPRQLYSQEAIAAARTMALEDAAKVADKFSSSSQYKTQRNLAEWIAKNIRALIGCEK